METKALLRTIKETDTLRHFGKIDKVIGMMIESIGPECKVGDLCNIYSEGFDRQVRAEVVGFRGNKALLMPYEEPEGIGAGALVEGTGTTLKIRLSPHLIGRVINAVGEPLDGWKLPKDGDWYEVQNNTANPLERPRINETLE
ncbi:MAG: flagellum-specific ATP synthase FliI, partial [Methanosarcina mazei]